MADRGAGGVLRGAGSGDEGLEGAGEVVGGFSSTFGV